MNPYLKKSLIGLFFGLNVVLSLFGFSSLHSSPYTGLRLFIQDNAAIVKSVDAGSPAFGQISAGDRLLEVDGRVISAIAFNLDPSYNRTRKAQRAFWEEERILAEAISADRPVRLRMERAGTLLDVTLTPADFPLGVALKRTLPLYLVGWTFLIVAYLVLRRNDHEIAVANFVIGFFVCISFASLAPFAYRDIVLSVSSFHALLVTGNLGSQGFSSAAIHMLLIFPRRKRILSSYPWLIVTPYIVYAGLASVHLAGIFESTYITTYFYTDTCLIVFFVNLLYVFFAEKNIVYKRQIQWVVFGMLAGLTAWLGLTSIPIVFGLSFIPEEISVLPTVIYPLCFAFAVTKYRLMDIDRIFDAAVIFGLTIAILEGIELVFLGLASKFIPFGQKAPYDSMAAVLLIVFLYVPLRNRVKNIVEKLFKRGDYDVEIESQRFITSLGLRDGVSPLEKFSFFAKELLGPSGICIMKFQGAAATVFFLDGDKADSTAAVIAGTSREMRKYFNGCQSPSYGYEVVKSIIPAEPLSKSDIENSLFAPISFGDDVSYLAVLLPKWNGTAYSNKDRSLLGAAASQVTYLLDAEQRRTSIAKITPPGIASSILLRTRLFESLEQGWERPVTWISGPAGSGKTTLIASYIASRNPPSIWYTVDEDDGDIATFFYYMGLTTVKSDGGKRRPLPPFSPEYLGGVPVFTKRWFNDFYSRLNPALPGVGKEGSKRGFMIVLDNYQDAPRNSLFHEVIAQGLEVVPEGIHVIILSREEPAASFAHLTANGRIGFLGWEEIRLTLDESRDIVRTKLRENIHEGMSDSLHAMTGGWVAGLVLMLERTKYGEEGFPPLKNLASEEIFTYFSNEFFAGMDAETRDFLLKTSCLPEITAEAAEKLTGDATSWQRLYRLSKNNFFTDKLSGEKSVYRYHPMFRDFLLSRARTVLSPDELLKTRRTAASLLENAGRAEDAVKLLQEARDWESLVRLILLRAQSLTAQGRYALLEGWISSIPDEIIEGTPYLLFWRACCIAPFQPAESRRLFDRTFYAFRQLNDRFGMFLAWSNASDIALQEANDFSYLDDQIMLLNSVLADDPTYPGPEVKERVTMSMFNALACRQPWNVEKGAWEEKALELLQKGHDRNLRMYTGVCLTFYHFYMGNMSMSARVVDQLRTEVASGEISPLMAISVKTIEAIYDFMASADFASSLGSVSDGLRMAEETGIHIWDNHIAGHGCAAALSIGDTALAGEYLARMKMNLARMRSFDAEYFYFLAAWLSLMEQDVPRALEHITRMTEVSAVVGFPFATAFCYTTRALIHHELGDHEQAARYLALGKNLADRTGSKLFQYTSLLFEAHMAFTNTEKKIGQRSDEDHTSYGMDCLRKAFSIGRAQEIMNIPGWLPGIMTDLCARALEAGIETDYARRLIRKRSLIPGEHHLHIETWPWPVKIRTLGGFELQVNDQRVTFPGKAQKKPLDLLKVLLSHGGREVSEEQLTEVTLARLGRRCRAQLLHNDALPPAAAFGERENGPDRGRKGEPRSALLLGGFLGVREARAESFPDCLRSLRTDKKGQEETADAGGHRINGKGDGSLPRQLFARRCKQTLDRIDARAPQEQVPQDGQRGRRTLRTIRAVGARHCLLPAGHGNGQPE